jgi:hypothetical protein
MHQLVNADHIKVVAMIEEVAPQGEPMLVDHAAALHENECVQSTTKKSLVSVV